MYYCIIPLLFLLCSFYAEAQNTFIKRYKNTAISESGVAVCILPNNQYAIGGQQANGFAWQSPMVVITDSAGNQLRHWVDTACNGCNPHDAVADSAGYIYVAGNFYGKAGLAKYDTLGNQIWQRLYSANGLESSINSIIIVNDSIVVVGGGQGLGAFNGSNPLVVAYNLNGDTLWAFASSFEFNQLANEFDVLSVTFLDSTLYLTGVVSDTNPQQPFFASLSVSGTLVNYRKIPENGLGFAISVLSKDSIFIAGCGVDSSLRLFNALYLVASNGQVLDQHIDSSIWNIFISKIELDRQKGMLYILTLDTVFENGTTRNRDKILAYSLPVNNLSQPLWQQTITSTHTGGSYRGLKLAHDGTVLLTATAIDNCPNCPYLAKIDKDACTDMACDTGFATGIVSPSLINVSFKLYPNPVNGGPLYYELQSEETIQTIEAVCYDLSGKVIPVTHTESYNTGIAYKAALQIDAGISNSIYLIKCVINGQHNIYGRFVKTD